MRHRSGNTIQPHGEHSRDKGGVIIAVTIQVLESLLQFFSEVFTVALLIVKKTPPRIDETGIYICFKLSKANMFHRFVISAEPDECHNQWVMTSSGVRGQPARSLRG